MDVKHDSLGLAAFAAWCGTTPEHAATKSLWGTRGARLTAEGWARVESVHLGEIESLSEALSEAIDLLEEIRPHMKRLRWAGGRDQWAEEKFDRIEQVLRRCETINDEG